MARTFDATVDFFDGSLELALVDALSDTPRGTTFSVWIRADGDDCETARVYTANEYLPVGQIQQDDWVVTADSIEDAANQLRALL
jgi:hypothetical protein